MLLKVEGKVFFYETHSLIVRYYGNNRNNAKLQEQYN